MPSSKKYAKNRNYQQEMKTARRRKETNAGSASGDATRHRARRKLKKKLGAAAIKGKDVGHKRSLKSKGSNSTSNLKVQSRKANRSHGGKIGSRKGKATGARKAHRKRR